MNHNNQYLIPTPKQKALTKNRQGFPLNRFAITQQLPQKRK